MSIRQIHKGGFWENGFFKSNHVSTVTKNYENYVDLVAKGDIFVVKRLNGKANSTMRILAIGIVLGKNFDRTIRVAWVMQNIDLRKIIWIYFSQ